MCNCFNVKLLSSQTCVLGSRKASHRDCSSEYPQHMYQTSSWYCNRAKHMFWSLKKSLTETVLLSTQNTCKDTLFFWRSDKNHMDLLWGRFREPDNYFYFRETILLLTQTKPGVIKPFPRSTQPSTTFIMLTNVKMPTIVGSLTLIIMINTSPDSARAREQKKYLYFNLGCSFEYPQHI